jgi:hypothetical protein
MATFAPYAPCLAYPPACPLFCSRCIFHGLCPCGIAQALQAHGAQGLHSGRRAHHSDSRVGGQRAGETGGGKPGGGRGEQPRLGLGFDGRPLRGWCAASLGACAP